ncbi:MAG: hemerythrin domain-containing protein [Deltaproteobacteria bacterium]|nr:hemerythrin domain-containing protein [Deltaproteobacteria bacterium]
MNPYQLLKEDHKKVKNLFKEYERAGEKAYKTKLQIAREVFHELDVHAAVEEEVFYPEVKAKADAEGRKLVAEGYEEHHVVKQLISELQQLKPEDERFDAKFKVLKENVEHHIEEEEKELFPEAKEALADEGAEVADRIERKKRALKQTLI